MQAASRRCATFTATVAPFNQRDLMAPVELAGSARRKSQRHACIGRIARSKSGVNNTHRRNPIASYCVGAGIGRMLAICQLVPTRSRVWFIKKRVG